MVHNIEKLSIALDYKMDLSRQKIDIMANDFRVTHLGADKSYLDIYSPQSTDQWQIKNKELWLIGFHR